MVARSEKVTVESWCLTLWWWRWSGWIRIEKWTETRQVDWCIRDECNKSYKEEDKRLWQFIRFAEVANHFEHQHHICWQGMRGDGEEMTMMLMINSRIKIPFPSGSPHLVNFLFCHLSIQHTFLFPTIPTWAITFGTYSSLFSKWWTLLSEKQHLWSDNYEPLAGDEMTWWSTEQQKERQRILSPLLSQFLMIPLPSVSLSRANVPIILPSVLIVASYSVTACDAQVFRGERERERET